MNEDGTLNAKSVLFDGKDRFEARKEIVRLFKEDGAFVKQENLRKQSGFQ